jgi:hypothetical protein
MLGGVHYDIPTCWPVPGVVDDSRMMMIMMMLPL